MTRKDISSREDFTETDKILAQKYAADFSIPLEVADVVAKRFPEYQEAKAFLFPDVNSLHTPAAIPDMEAAADKVIESLDRREGILIYSHDDVDGYSSAAIMYRALKDFCRTGELVYVYPLIREKDGYILNGEVLREYKRKGVKLLITVDFGISSEQNFRTAEEAGLELVVCDHHETFSSDFAIPAVDPKRPDSHYPFRDLAGVGVTFKFAQFLYQRIFDLAPEEFYRLKKEFFPLVMLGTISDRVLLRGENRIFCTHGLQMFNSIHEPWIDQFRKDNKLSIAHVVSEIIPTVASASYCDPNDGVGILVSDDSEYVSKTMAKLKTVTSERRQNVELLFKNAVAAAKFFPRVIISVIPFSKQHYLGSVAARLKGYYNRTTLVIGIKGDRCFGELRSNDVDLFNMLYHLKEYFLDFGGHRRAAGFTMMRPNLDVLVEKIRQYVSNFDEILEHGDPSAGDSPEAFVNKSDIRVLASLAPFGEGNPAPILTDGVSIYTIDNRFVIRNRG